jgi:hypothetical protein
MILVRWRGTLALIASAVMVAGCGKENATGIAGPLIPQGSIQTYDLVLDGSSFLISDTTLSGYSIPNTSGYLFLARTFGGVVNANALVRFVQAPPTIQVADSAGTIRTDTLPKFFAGNVVLTVDTTAAASTDPITFELYRTAEAFDAASATWTLRVDTLGVSLPWQQRGGTRGPLVSRTTWMPGQDSIVFAVDSATVKAWSDTTDATRGALIVVTTPNSRIRASTIGFNVQAHSSIRRDTVVTVTTGNVGSTFISDPPPPQPTTDLRVGGQPSWRSYFQFRDNLDSLSVPCPTQTANCHVLLKNATINYAALLLQPLAMPAAYSPEDSIIVGAYTVFPNSTLPIGRSPLGTIVGATKGSLKPAQFTGGTQARVEVPITGFIAILAGARDTTAAAANSTARPTSIALLSSPEGRTFGFGSFASRRAGTAVAPKLRLVVTVASEVQLP